MNAPVDRSVASLLFLAAVSLCLSLVLTPVFRALFYRVGRFDQPDHVRKLHPHPVPRAGGIPVMLAYLGALALLLISPLTGRAEIAQSLPLAWRLIPAAIVVFATGLMDDLFGLKPWHKIAGQLYGAALACWAGVSITSAGSWNVPIWAGIPLTLLWLLASTNALNLIDGVDGLAAGVGLLATLGAMIGALLLGHTGLAIATAPLAGALLGFLRYNFNPASVFLGDSGSLTVGFLLGCYAVVWSHKAATLVGMTAPLVALAVPLLDTALSILRRVLRRRPIFAADRAHIHHKLLDRGLTPRRVVLVFYLLCGIAAAISVVQSVASKELAAAGILVLFCFAAWAGVQNLGYAEFGLAGRLISPATFLRVLNAQIRLRVLEEQLANAENVDASWQLIHAACRDLGFSRVMLRIGAEARDEWLVPDRSPSSCWTLRIPLSERDYVNLGRAFNAPLEPLVLEKIAGVLRTGLVARLAPASDAGRTRVHALVSPQPVHTSL